jgi:hypothetical protein
MDLSECLIEDDETLVIVVSLRNFRLYELSYDAQVKGAYWEEIVV